MATDRTIERLVSAIERIAADIMVIKVRLEQIEKSQSRMEIDLCGDAGDPIDTPPDLLGDLFKKPKD